MSFPIAETQFPVISEDAVKPSVAEVAVLERTRTVAENGEELGTFTDATRPTAAEVESIVDQAAQQILSALPFTVPEAMYPRIQHAIALQAAVFIEASFFREQLAEGSVQLYLNLLNTLIGTIADVAGGGRSGRRVDSVLVRGSETEFAPDYPLPAPRVVLEIPSTR